MQSAYTKELITEEKGTQSENERGKKYVKLEFMWNEVHLVVIRMTLWNIREIFPPTGLMIVK